MSFRTDVKDGCGRARPAAPSPQNRSPVAGIQESSPVAGIVFPLESRHQLKSHHDGIHTSCTCRRVVVGWMLLHCCGRIGPGTGWTLPHSPRQKKSIGHCHISNKWMQEPETNSGPKNNQGTTSTSTFQHQPQPAWQTNRFIKSNDSLTISSMKPK